MKKHTNSFENVTAAVTPRRKITRYVTPNGKERMLTRICAMHSTTSLRSGTALSHPAR
jgi:hypothetical protein